MSNSAAGGGGALRRDLKRLRGCGETASEGTARAGRARGPRRRPRAPRSSWCRGSSRRCARCAKKPCDRARDPGRRGARAARSEAPPETGSRTARGSFRATAVARSVPPNPDPIGGSTAPARQPERFSSVRLPHATRDGGKAEMETRSGRTHRSACSASLALYTSSARDNPDRSSVTFVRLIVRDRRETPHSTPARVLVAQASDSIARNVALFCRRRKLFRRESSAK